jgi:murein DD-endopeptidase MepM/ murein hydrolase activator NlpD
VVDATIASAWRVRHHGRMTNLSLVRAAGVVAALTAATACEVVHERDVDTVALVDTVVRVDSIVRQDTVRIADAAATPLASGTGAAPVSAVTNTDLAYLRARRLLIPVAGVPAAALPNTFDEARAGGSRRHDAIDILAPRGTPVLSADAGRVARLETTAGGGLSVYATDPSGRFVYYYAHLDRYHPGLREGQPLARGDTIGAVGTTGNAPAATPHLHFAISALGEPRRWWDGPPINPHPLLTAAP